MAWADVPAKLEKYRTMQYGGDRQADATLAAHAGVRVVGNTVTYSIDYVPDSEKVPLEQELDYRIGACEQLEVSRGWSKDMLRKV